MRPVEEDENDTDGENDDRVASASGLFTCDTTELVAVAYGQCLLGHFGNGGNGFTRTVTVGRKSVYLNGTVEIETGKCLSSIYLGQVDELADGGHLTRRGTYEHIVQGVLVQTISLFGLYHDAVEFGETIEIGRIVSADEARQNAEHIGSRNACTLASSGIHFDGILREFCVK